MRKITNGDIHRKLLNLEYLREKGNNNKEEERRSFEAIDKGLILKVDNNTSNNMLKDLYGVLQYRSYKMIRRTFERFSSKPEYHKNSISANQFNMIDIWYEFSQKYFIEKDKFYINIELFEQWKRDFHGVDEDLILSTAFVRKKFSSKELDKKEVENFIRRQKTFMNPYEPNVDAELSKGIAQQHLHLSGAYPAPFYWVAIMNNRLKIENLFSIDKNEKFRYFDEDDFINLKTNLYYCKKIRLFFFQLIKKLIDGNTIKDDIGNAGKLIKEIKEEMDNDSTEVSYENMNRKINEEKKSYNDYMHIFVSHIIKENKIICESLIGERILLIYLIKEIDKRESKALSQLFWIYCNIKSKFLSIIQQQEGIAGFDYFQHTLGMIRWRNASNESDRFAEEIGEYLQESGWIVKQEFMIAPQKGDSDYDQIIGIVSKIREAMNRKLSSTLKKKYGEVKCGIIVHFIKNEGNYLRERLSEDKRGYKIYHFTQRIENRKALERLMNYKKKENTREKNANIKIVAIDTANKELFTPPEIFGEIYRKAYKMNFQLNDEEKFVGKTYHVGEDFESIVTGMRRIYEAIEFLDIGLRDRLGHCTAIGFDIKTWVNANPIIEINKIDYLDDSVFEWNLLRKCEDYENKRIRELEERIFRLSNEIFGEAVSPQILLEAWNKRFQIEAEDEQDYARDTFIPNWIKYQSDLMNETGREGTHNVINSPEHIYGMCETYSIDTDNGKLTELPINKADRIAKEYLFCKHTIRRFLKMETVDVLREIEHIEKLQKTMVDFIKRKGITIESNPISNWLIGGFKRITDVPCVQWILKETEIDFTINTDDPAVFGNSISNEYYMFFSCILRGNESIKGLSRKRAVEVISRIRYIGLKSSFLE